uniref:Uncharacterized protein n=1 Tax=Timema bartmani TaxID=61472 RepID=A0A7R9F6G1_9NEOP|nr:unnamed protein product [Timema bartmani]
MSYNAIEMFSRYWLHDGGFIVAIRCIYAQLLHLGVLVIVLRSVLWFPGKGPIAGSPQAIARLVELGKTVFLLTNNSMASIDRYHGVCQNLGMPVPKAAPPNLSTAWTAPQSMFSNPPVTSSPLYSAPMRTPLSIGSLDEQAVLRYLIRGSFSDWLTSQLVPFTPYSVNRLFPGLSGPHRRRGSSVSLGEY